MFNRGVVLESHLVPLAQEAFARPACDISVHVKPDESVTNRALRGTNSRMGQVVKDIKYLSPESGGDYRVRLAPGNVAQQGGFVRAQGDIFQL